MVWRNLRRRCNNKKHRAYPNYGGRGIKVCDRWNESFESFLLDMGERPDGHSIDRINNNGNYSPENCRWANRKEQARNTRKCSYITFGSATRSLAYWCEFFNINRNTVKFRIIRGSSPHQALTKPVAKRKQY